VVRDELGQKLRKVRRRGPDISKAEAVICDGGTGEIRFSKRGEQSLGRGRKKQSKNGEDIRRKGGVSSTEVQKRKKKTKKKKKKG